MNSRPGLQLVQTIVTASGPGSAALAQTWQSQFNFQDVVVWGDTTDFIYSTWMSGPPANGGYPAHLVIELDTMTLTAFNSGGPEGGSSAVQAILDNPHPCAEI
jgi:hypothetical protein